MKGFKNSTKTHYSRGGDAKGGAKGAAKINKVMGEFKRGELHSGSKEGPKVTSQKQATAIALSEARKAGAKIPQPVQKKSLGGVLKAVGSVVAPVMTSAATGQMPALGLAGLAANLLKKKQSGQPPTPQEEKTVAAASSPQQAKHGGPIKKGNGGVIPKESTSARPKDSKGRPITDKQLRQANKDTGGMTAAQVKAAGEAVARGNRAPRERMPTDAEAARMMTARKKGGGVGSFNSQPLVGKGGLSAMPRGKKC